MKLPAWTYLVVFVGGAAIMWYCIRGCEQLPPDHSELMQKNDSLVKANAANVAATFQFKDSTNKVITSLQKDKDSLTKENKAYKSDISKSGKDIQGLLDKINEADQTNDQAAKLSACDSLAKEVAMAKGQVHSYMNSNDSLHAVNDQIIANKSAIITRLSDQLTETNQSFFNTQLILQKTETDYNRLRAKSNKKFAIGPSLGYYVTPNGSGPGIGISLTYTPIKF